MFIPIHQTIKLTTQHVFQSPGNHFLENKTTKKKNLPLFSVEEVSLHNKLIVFFF